jgi:two-component sensor histidine kinase
MSRAKGRLLFLEGGGRMGALMRAFDWSKSPLGDPENWPNTLKMAVGTCLASRFPMVVWWGPQLLMLYNDAWQPILGDTKHPQGLGRPGAESWPETWPIVGAQFESALHGAASWSEDLLLASDRRGYMEECYFTYSHSPLKDEHGGVVGVLSVVSETTARVVGERRLRLLRDLLNLTLRAASATLPRKETEHLLVELLCKDNPDIPFALLYAMAGDCAKLSVSVGIDAIRTPDSVCRREDDFWSIGRVLAGEDLVSADHPPAADLPGGVWPERTRQHVALALRASDPSEPLIGVLVVGANSRLRLDERYLDFLRLVGVRIAASLGAIVNLERQAAAAKTNEMLLLELQHRSRNLLALVQAISNQTARSSSSVEAFQGAFPNRLAALGRAQDFLSRTGDFSPLRKLVAVELDILSEADRARVTVDGPHVWLPRHAAQLVLLALHELTTNAIRHGVLSRSRGGLSIAWTALPESGLVRLDWKETFESPQRLKASARRGFGRSLIEQALPSQLRTKTEFKLSRSGLRCTIEIPAESASAGLSEPTRPS